MISVHTRSAFASRDEQTQKRNATLARWQAQYQTVTRRRQRAAIVRRAVVVVVTLAAGAIAYLV